MRWRFLSFLLLWAALVLIPWFGGPIGAALLIAAAAMLTQIELYQLLQRCHYQPYATTGVIAGLIVTVGGFLAPYVGLTSSGMLVPAMLLVVMTALARPGPGLVQKRIMPTLFGLFLVPYMLSYFIGFIHQGIMELGIWTIGVAKFSDVGALLWGRTFGRHKLSPSISPGKTWEGVIGGIATATALGGLAAWLVRPLIPFEFDVLAAVLIAIPIATIAVSSDLLESAIKREAGVKDSGRMIPGIGGAFDLMDSLLLTGPVGYTLVMWWIERYAALS
ncbi:MAG: phosphatidate cytidylyltransferase [Verrucomicrobiota bacterium JB022]|nr:phosphatidate cytidylyltransferase [Verrucomicrobiota bacterium JB022]